MPPDETEFFHTDRAHYEYLRQQREAAEDAAARERSARSGCGLLWLLPALLAVASVVALDDVLAAYPSWSGGLLGVVPPDWVDAAGERWWAALLLGLGVLTPLWLLAWAVAVVRRQVAVHLRRGWLLGPLRWAWLTLATAARALLTLAGLVTAWQVVRLSRAVPLQEVADVRTPTLVVVVLVGVASALRALALHRQLPSASPVSGGW
ncbi:hypothetical protein AVL62_10485 [Serinicoccus chungangensis]|uniref:Uncharacterized protein n=1 Tax=Serinicoccus chungangensis TaxID=767452 RepID=A0A0W8IEF5_9MICO|nr:hypothetical protein [Serinicoccus chungangensis]KUG58341.1 hypothetical protein AVL62_10485 [Serinicoccus chungangensis]